MSHLLHLRTTAFLLLLHVGCAAPSPKIRVAFSPQGNCTSLIINQIDQAQEIVLVQAYYLTSSPITDALIRAHERQVVVRVLIDQGQQRQPQIRRLLNHNVSVAIDVIRGKGIAHNKVIIIDSETVLTGSFNFTYAAERYNAENLLLITDPRTHHLYKENWQQRAATAERLMLGSS